MHKTEKNVQKNAFIFLNICSNELFYVPLQSKIENQFN